MTLIEGSTSDVGEQPESGIAISTADGKRNAAQIRHEPATVVCLKINPP
jgi:hypothetical protein